MVSHTTLSGLRRERRRWACLQSHRKIHPPRWADGLRTSRSWWARRWPQSIGSGIPGPHRNASSVINTDRSSDTCPLGSRSATPPAESCRRFPHSRRGSAWSH